VNKMIRQGDVLLVPIDRIPVEAKIAPERGRRFILAKGEQTGHHHSIAFSDRVAMFREDGSGGGLFLSVTGAAPAALEHQEHSTLDIQPGKYAVVIQRTYHAGVGRRVAD
jgi:hypothetical protein